MASIYPNFKNGKVVSFKIKPFLGRDENGKQIFRCKTWTPKKAMTESKLKQTAEREATIWENEVALQHKNEKKAFVPAEITFKDFTEKVWFPSKMSEKDHRASTIAFHSYLLKIILDYLGELKLSDINPSNIDGYLNYLKNTYKTKDNRALSAKTIKRHYSTLNLIFEYAEKICYIELNPLKKISTSKLTKHKVNALSKGGSFYIYKRTQNTPP